MFALNKYKGNDEAESEFYLRMLTSMGILATNIAVTPFATAGSFVASSPDGTLTQRFFDVGNPASGVITSPIFSPAKSVYHGALYVNGEFTAIGAGTANGRMGFVMGPSNAPVEYRLKQFFNSATTYNNGQALEALDCVFTYLMGTVAGSGAAVYDLTTYYHFVGKKIDFQ